MTADIQFADARAIWRTRPPRTTPSGARARRGLANEASVGYASHTPPTKRYQRRAAIAFEAWVASPELRALACLRRGLRRRRMAP